MLDSATQTTDLGSILRAICTLTQDAWCFIPVSGDRIQYCSQWFLDLWKIPYAVPLNEDYILFEEDGFTEAAASFGLPGSWLHDLCRHRVPQRQRKIARADGLTLIAHSQVILDSQGKPIGRLVAFEPKEDEQLGHSVIERVIEAKKKLAILSPREEEVLNHLFNGLTSKAIGIREQISEKTVEKHRANIMHKLRARSIAELVRIVSDARIVEPDV